MSGKKSARLKGKIKLSKMFQNFKPGDLVCIEREMSRKASFPKQLAGRTGTIESARGKAYIVKIKEYKQVKSYIIEPIHLRKI